MDLLLLALLGVGTGIISSLFGLGGGIILVPALTLMGYEIVYAVGLSIVQMVFSSFWGTFLNYRKKLIAIRLGILLGIGGMLGSSLSGLLLSHLSAQTLYIIFLGFLCFSFYQYFFGKKITHTPKAISSFQKILILVLSGCLIGIFSSSLGIGGGLLLIPICGYFFGLNSKQVAPLGLFFICFSSLSGAISLYYSGFVHLEKGILLASFAVIGATIGNNLLQKISDKNHKKVLALIYLFSIASIASKLF